MPIVDIGRRRSDTMQALMRDVDEFLRYIAIVKTPEVDAVRDRLERSLSAARGQLLNTGARAGLARSRPRNMLIAAVALAALIGSIAGLRRARSTPRRFHNVR